jgi:ParB family chromosome partitioning protein
MTGHHVNIGADAFPVREIGLDSIAELPNRLRKLQPKKVDELAVSMKLNGLINPITVRRKGVSGIAGAGTTASPAQGYLLVAGRHRLHAAKKLKLSGIRCHVIDLDDDGAELIEIDENLIRADLSPAERALHVEARKAPYEKLHPETKHGAVGRGRKKSSQLENSFVDDTAKKTGKGRSTVARDATRAAKIPDLADVVGTSLDKGEELDALAKLPAEEQSPLIAKAKSGKKVSAIKPKAKPKSAPKPVISSASKVAAAAASLCRSSDPDYMRILRAFAQAPLAARLKFLEVHETDELVRLREENARLREEIAALKRGGQAS